MESKILVIIPTYNEIENIENIVAEVFKYVPTANILVVDDNSPDGTGAAVEKLSEKDDRVRLIMRPGKLGLGTAYITGFQYAIENEYDYIFEMDADFSHNPAHMPRFLDAIKGADLVIGSRYISGGGIENWSISRKFVSRCGSLYSRLLLSVPYKDLTGGFKCFRRKALQAIPLEEIQSEGYAFQIEVTYRTHKRGFLIKEIPILFADRRGGHSKMSWKIFFEAIYRVWQMRFTI